MNNFKNAYVHILKAVVLIIILISVGSCFDDTLGTPEISVDSNSTRLELETAQAQIDKDTLFEKFYLGMPKEEVEERGFWYSFFSGDDVLQLYINRIYDYNGLSSIVLESRDELSIKQFERLMSLYKDKYQISEKSVHDSIVVIAERRSVKRIYWMNEFSKDFEVFSDIHRNRFVVNGNKVSNTCVGLTKTSNANVVKKPGYHIHATNVHDGERWVFGIEPKLDIIKGNIITDKYTIVNPSTNIEIEIRYLFLDQKAKKEIANLSRYQVDLGGMKMDAFLSVKAENVNIMEYDKVLICYSRKGIQGKPIEPIIKDEARNIQDI